MKIVNLFFFFILAFQPVFAIEKTTCDMPSPTAAYQIGKINLTNTPKPVGLFYDWDDCPNLKNPKCRSAFRLKDGSPVLIQNTLYKNQTLWTCIGFLTHHGDSQIAYVQSKNISPFVKNQKRLTQKDWLGVWKDGKQSIVIKPNGSGKSLSISGNAFWQGAGDSAHVGSVDSTAIPKGDFMQVLEGNEIEGNEIEATPAKPSEFDCRLTLKLIPPFLLAEDNEHCGGINVRFNGIYTKKRTQIRPLKRPY